MTAEIHDEDDLQACIMEKLMLQMGLCNVYYYAQINRIAGRPISPEIDLLVIRGPLKKETLIGYEFKYLRSTKKAVNYRHIYQGIGQALLYFHFGLDISYLVLGISKKIRHVDQISLWKKIDVQLKNILKDRINCFGVKICYEKDPERELQTLIEHTDTFPFHLFEDFKFQRDSLLRGNFAFNLKFLERHKKSLKKHRV